MSFNDSLIQQDKCLEDRVEQVTKDALKYKDQCEVMTEVSKVPINQGRSFDEVYMKANKKGKWLVLSMALSRLCHL